jgi:hypothetical protein
LPRADCAAARAIPLGSGEDFRDRSVGHGFDFSGRRYGPRAKAFATIDPQAFEAESHALLDDFNVAKDGTFLVPSAYLEVVITMKA